MSTAENEFTITEMSASLINYEPREAIGLITLNDPPANTYSYEMMQQLDAAILEARMDESVQVIVLTGSGEKFFCAGANIQMLSDVTPEFKYYFCLHAIELMATGELFDFEKGETLGLVNRIVDATDGADFMKQVMDYARQFTTPNKASRAVGRIKRAVQTGAEIPFESALALERELQQQ